MNLYAVIGILLSLAYVGNTETVFDTIKDIAKKSEQVIGRSNNNISILGPSPRLSLRLYYY